MTLFRYFRVIRDSPVLRLRTVHSTVCRSQFSGTAADPSDVELSYTTYPDHEHSIDHKKKPLIFTHGLFGAKGNLHSVAKHLSNDGRRVITYDARNHGDSQHTSGMDYIAMADDMAGLIDDLKLSAPVVMGHSMGGKTAMTLALTQPDKMTALIVADVAPISSPGGSGLKEFAEAMRNVDIPPETSLSQARKLVQVQLTPIVKDRGIIQFLLTNLREFDGGKVWWRMNLDAILNNIEQIMGFPLEAGEKKPFKKPTLFVFGEKSDHYRTENIKGFYPNAEISAIKDAGHFVHAEKPLEFVKVVNQFLRKIDASSR